MVVNVLTSIKVMKTILNRNLHRCSAKVQLRRSAENEIIKARQTAAETKESTSCKNILEVMKMETINMLLCCGAGMSSGFLAQKTRKAAKKRGISGSIDARSESEVSQYLDSVDILLLGPHYASFKEEMTKQAAPHNVVVDVIPQDIYGMLDGEGLLDFAIQKLSN